MTHERFANLLSDYAESSLPAAEAAACEAHSLECADCRELAERFRRTLRDLHAFPWREVPPGFTARVLERTTRNPVALGFWETAWIWIRFPRLSPLGALALLALPLLILAGTPDGRTLTREVSMATHRTYSDAVRLYYRSGDLRGTALAMGREIPGQIGQTVEWIRHRLAREETDRTPPSEAPDRSQQRREEARTEMQV